MTTSPNDMFWRENLFKGFLKVKPDFWSGSQVLKSLKSLFLLLVEQPYYLFVTLKVLSSGRAVIHRCSIE